MSFFFGSLGRRRSSAAATARKSSVHREFGATTAAAAGSVDCQRPSDAGFPANHPVLPAELRESGERPLSTRFRKHFHWISIFLVDDEPEHDANTEQHDKRDATAPNTESVHESTGKSH